MKPHLLSPVLTSPVVWLAALMACASGPAMAQAIYRCAGANGAAPEYINNAKDAQSRGCKAIQGGNVTVVQSTGTPAGKGSVRMIPAVPPGTPARSDGGNADQKARDSDSRTILESELKKAEAKLAEQQKEFNNGQPEKQGIESKNYQRYLDRVAELKDSITRNESDIAGLKRELSRLPSSN